jgi:hypothetical protein
MNSLRDPAVAVGRYLLSPLSHPTDGGTFRASVSIRSGQGRSSHHRVFRLEPRFSSAEGALLLALTQGQWWLQGHRLA